MKILITGINGFVGKTLYRVLSSKHEVFGTYNNGNALYNNCYKCDLTSFEETESVFENIKDIDFIVHLSAQMASPNNVNDLSVLNANSCMAKNIALQAKKHSIKNIINLSSSSVYPNIDGVYDEASVPNPALNTDCIYGLSKLNSEIILDYFFSKSNNVMTHLRTVMVYGDEMNSSRIIPIIEKEIKDYNTVTLYGNGLRLLNLIHVDKLAFYISYFIDCPVNGIINVGDECVSVLNLAKQIVSKKGNAQTKIILKEEGNRMQFVVDIKKLKTILSTN